MRPNTKATLATLAFPIALEVTCCTAISWMRPVDHNAGKSRPSNAPKISGDIQAIQPTHEEISTLIRNKDTLEKYIQRSDCFRTAAKAIHTRCGELDMREDELVKAAISMTLCELATAKHHSTPFECVPFTLDPNINPPGPRSQGECVDALSRSAQFWASYSGYLREVPQLCFAFRRWHDIDTAREIYRNISVEQTLLIQYLISREQNTETTTDSWATQITKLHDVVAQITRVADNVDANSKRLSLQFAQEFDKVLELFAITLSDLERRQLERESHVIRTAQSSLAELSHQHSQELQNIVPSLENAFVDHLSPIFAHSRAQNQASLNIAIRASQIWAEITRDMSDFTKAAVTISSIASEARHSVNHSLGQAYMLYQVQRETLALTDNLNDKILHLTATTHVELEKINATATLLHLRLSQDHSTFRWWYSAFVWVTEFIFKAGSGSLIGHFHFSIVHVVLMLLAFIGHLCKAYLAGLLTILHSYQRRRLQFTGILPLGLPALSRHKCTTYPAHSQQSLNRTGDAAQMLDPRTKRLRHFHVSRIPERLYRSSS